MSQDELEILNLLADAWAKFLALEEIHSWDRVEFMHIIHMAQNMVLAREGHREYGLPNNL